MNQDGDLAQLIISDKEFNRLFRKTVESTIESGKQACGVYMTFYIHGYHIKNDERAIMPVLFADWPPPGVVTKAEALLGVMSMFRERLPGYVPAAIMHVSEAWVAAADGPVGKEWHAEEQPNRREILLVSGATFDMRIRDEFYEMVRDDKEQLVDFKLDPAMKGFQNNLVQELYKAFARLGPSEPQA
jgi:hypothetical protein